MKYRLTPEAEGDLLAIWNYSDDQFGERQADRYLKGMESRFDSLASGRSKGRACRALVPDTDSEVLFHKYQSHYIFYIESEVGIDVLTVIHTSRQRVIEDFLAEHEG